MMKCSAPKFQLKVLVDGKPVQEYHKDERVFVEGRKGSRFSLLIKNLCGNRILVHPTVDGLSAMNGKPASQHDNGRGYILSPYAEEIIPGWRLDDTEVAEFYFAGSGDSYAEREGMGENKGVIACAVWDELQYQITYSSVGGQSAGKLTFDSFSHGSTKGGRGAGQSVGFHPDSGVECNTGNLGTGFGERVEHAVQRIAFTAATSTPVVTAVIFYDDRRGLEARGIKVSRKKYQSPGFPNPFPKDGGGCTPPAGWNG